MKRILCVLLNLVFLLAFAGCTLEESSIKEPVRFFYQRSEFAYHTEDSVIRAEIREAAGHAKDLPYLLSNYLLGPTEDGLILPFPSGTKLISVQQEENTVTVVLSDTLRSLSDSQFSLACACISLTCMELTNAQTVTVINGDQTLSTTRDQLLLFDESTVGYGDALEANTHNS